MKSNVGSIDKVVRILVAVLFAILILTGSITGLAAIVLGIFAAVFLLTAFIGFCPLYFLLKLNTAKKTT